MNLSGLLDNNVIAGNDTLFNVEEILNDGNYRNILLVTGKSSFESCGAKDFFDRLDNNFTRISFSGKTLQISFINESFKNLHDAESYDLVLGIGGGSVLDTAKIFSLMISNRFESADDLVESGGGPNKMHLILIPTTAGPGSEATAFAVLYNQHIKYSIVADPLNVTYTILDPQLLRNVPQNLMLITLLDALSQAVESIWSVNSTSESLKYAKTALQIFKEQNLLAGGEFQDLNSILLASHLAGKAINISRTTAAHAFSYPLTYFLAVPHGLAVSIFLIEFFRFNYEVNESSLNDKRGVRHVCSQIIEILDILGIQSVDLFVSEMWGLIKRIQFSWQPEKMGGREDFYGLVSEGINLERLKNNPRNVSENDAGLIIDNVYAKLKNLADS